MITTLLLAAICLLGLALRLYRLEEQSLWWDDYNGLAHLTLEGFLASMQEARRVNPEGAPLYHVVQYAFAQVIGSGEYAQRLLNVFIGVATIPMVYAIGRSSFGVRAGLLAALLFAMSPPHIYHAQSLRIYPLAMLLSAAALLSMHRVLTQSSRRWVFLNALFNGLLCMTHLFGLFAVFAQGIAAILLLLPRQWKRFASWAFLQFVCLIPAVYWVAMMPQRTAGDFWHFSFPSLGDIAKDLVGDDLTDFAVNRAANPMEFLGLSLEVPWLAATMAYLLMGVSTAVAVWALFQVFMRRRDGGAGTKRDERQVSFVLMLCFWALPVLSLLCVAFFWRPVIYPRYTLYACLGLYVLAGGLLQALPAPRMRHGLVVVLIAAYAYQLALLLPSDTRTQWRPAARDIAAQAASGDIVLVGGTSWPDNSHRSFCYHLPASSRFPVSTAISIEDAMEQLRCHFAQPDAGTAWYVLNTHYFTLDPQIAYDYLEANGANFVQEDYPAEEYLKVYRVEGWPNAPEGSALVHPPAHSRAEEMENRFRELGIEGAAPAFRRDFARAIERDVVLSNDIDAYIRVYLACLRFHALDSARECLERVEESSSEGLFWLIEFYGAFAAGDLDAALTTLLALPHETISDSQARLQLEVTLWASGERDAALTSFEAHRNVLNREQIPMIPLYEALMLGSNDDFREAALEHRRQLRTHAYQGEGILYRAGGLESWISACHPQWSPGPVSPDKIETALEIVRSMNP